MDDLEKALVDIVRTYLSQETSAINNQEVKQDVNGNTDIVHNQEPSESSDASSEFTSNVYQCLRDKGVLKEVHAFLRYKLVDVLQEKYPQVIKSGCDTKFDSTAIDLVEDFLIAHKLLFTYSVLASELNGSYSSKRESGKYEKLPPREAEALLENLNIPRDSVSSKQILRLYVQDEHRSLIECFVDLMPTPTRDSNSNKDQTSSKDSSPREAPPKSSAEDRLSLRGSEVKSQRTDVSEVDDLSRFSGQTDDRGGSRTNGYSTRDKAFLRERLEVELTRNYRNQNESGAKRPCEDSNDLQRIKNEIESDLQTKLAAKEAELEKAFSEKLAAMKRILDQERRNWLREKAESEENLQVQKHKVKLGNDVRSKGINGLAYDSPQTDNSTTDDIEAFNNNRHFSARPPKPQPVNRKPQVHFDSPMSNGHYQQPKLKPLRKDKVPDYSTASLHLRSVQDDRVAFLQLSMEKQSEEIRKLQSELQRKNSLKDMEPVKLINEATTVAYDPELETFLEESKRRFADIEQQAAAVTSTLRQVFQRASSKQRAPTGASIRNSIDPPSRLQHVINPPKPSFLTSRGSFRSNLTSFLVDDAIPSNDFNFPSVLQSMPNTVAAHQFLDSSWRPQPISRNPTLPSASTAVTTGQQQFSPIPSKLLTVRTEASTDLTRPRPPPTFAPESHVTFELPPFLQSTASASSKATSCSNINIDASAQLRSASNLRTLHGPTPILSPPKRLIEVNDTAEKAPDKIAQEVTSDTDLSLKLAKRSGAFVTSKIQSRSNSIAEDEPVQTRKNRSNSRDKGQVVSSNQLMRDESVSVPELSHADGGDTSDNMAEDDFWAI